MNHLMGIEILALLKQELLLTLIIFILLFIKIGSTEWKIENLLNLVNFFLLINFIAGFFLKFEGSLFSQMFYTNKLIILEKNLLNLATLIISLQSYNWLKTHKHLLEFYILMLSTLVGMFFMISSGNLLIFYLGLELSTIPLAAMANFDLGKRQSSEAAFKLIISSAFSSGLLLFGISLVYGTTGSLNFDIIRQQVDGSSLQLFAFILLLSGFAFKISVVPFHLWTADVYEGSPVAVTSYLSVVSKAAIFFVLVPVLYTLFKSIAGNWYAILVLLSILTMFVGNLFAIRQNNLKRLLAFSSISQVGFILVGISGSSQAGSASVIYFILIYIFSNLGAFGVIAFISAITGKENIEDYRGLYSTNPLLCWILAIALFSLAGIPPTAGFFGKFFLLMAGAASGNYILIIIAVLNIVIGLYYYLRVVKAMFMDVNDQPIEKLKIAPLPKIAMLLCAIGIIITGFIGWVYDHVSSMSTSF
jgi:NADH-quinone oxidoreductase subunit N